MKSQIKYIIVILLFPVLSYAKEWDAPEIGLGASYTALHIVDWGQTLRSARDSRYWENNIILGKHPSRDKINLYFISAYIINLMIADYLGNWKGEWLTLGIGIELGAIHSNYSIGVRKVF